MELLDNPPDLFEPSLDPMPEVPKGASEELRQQLRQEALTNHYFFCKGVLGYTRLKPEVHIPICRWLESTEGVFPRRLLLQPRSTFKTTILTIAQTIRDAIRDPNIRILIVAGTATNAERMMLEIRHHFELNPMLRWLFPEVIPDNFNTARWNNQELQLKRTALWREPTIDAIGAGGMIESRHYDIIRLDDPTGEAEFKSQSKMMSRIEWTDGLESLLINPQKQIDLAATHWGQVDVPHHFLKSYGGLEPEVPIGPRATKKGKLITKYWLPDIENGESTFPEQIPMDFLVRMKQRNPVRYYAQYANRPTADGPVTFKSEYYRYYVRIESGPLKGYIQKRDRDGNDIGAPIDPMQMTRIVVVDPAVAETKKSSRNAILVLGKGSGRDRFILETKIGHYPPDEMVDELFRIDREWQPEFFSIEGIAYQKAIKYWIMDRAKYEDVPDLVIEEYRPESDMRKDERIKGLQPAFRNGLWWMAEDMIELQEELENWPRSEFRDALDALSQSEEYWPYSTDMDEILADRAAEDDFLEFVVGAGRPNRDEEFNEDSFLWELGPTGYGGFRSNPYLN